MENICRTCLRTPKKSFPLYDDIGLIYKIETLSSIEIVTNKEYPSTICEECANNVNRFFNFRKVIINSNRDIKERYETLKATNFTCKPRSKKNNVALGTPPEKSSSDEETIKNEKVNIEKHEITENSCQQALTTEIQQSDNNNKQPQAELDSLKRDLATLKIWKCKDCSLIFNSRFKLQNHRRTEHISPGVCNICGVIVRADNLRKHVRLHSEGPKGCKECGKVFKNSESLRSHALIHKGLSFTCEICGKVSKVKTEHHRHLKTHTDPEARKVTCSLCGKRVHEIRKHILSHTGERPHVCTYCHKGFTSPYALKVHTRQHTQETPYVCEYCSSGFRQKVSLTAHLKSKHRVTS